MLEKRCTHCQRNSYSSGDLYRWICPYCGKDLTFLKASPARHRFALVRPRVPHHIQQRRKPLSRSDEDLSEGRAV